MKVKSLATIAKKRKNIIIFEDLYRRQWVGDGVAMYLLAGMPRVTENNILSVFDIPSVKRDEYMVENIEMPENVNFEDYTEEKLLKENFIDITVYDRQLKYFLTSTGITFLDMQYLKPLDDSYHIDFYERWTTTGTTYIAIKDENQELIAVIMPYNCITEKFIKDLEEMLARCKTMYKWEE